MKKVFSIIALSAMTLSLSSFTNQDLLIFEAPTCFEGARALVIMRIKVWNKDKKQV